MTRLLGLDVARACAVFAMVVVNFKLVLAATQGSPFLLAAAGVLEGRAVAIFIVLAGVGISFLASANSAAAVPEQQTSRLLCWSLTHSQKRLLKRALVLLVLGVPFTLIWPADILHFYALYFVAAALLLRGSTTLWVSVIVAVNVLFILLMVALPYESGWDFDSLTYLDLWTLEGFARHWFYNGFHPLFPWLSFVLLGMCLGRQLKDGSAHRKVWFKWALGLWLLSKALSTGLLQLAAVWRLPQEDAAALFAAQPMPPMPLYIVSAGSSAILVILVCLWAAERWPQSGLIRILAKAGAMSLTLYFAHVLIGMGTLEALGLLQAQSIEFALMAAGAFMAAALLFAQLWLRFFKQGPVEWVMGYVK